MQNIPQFVDSRQTGWCIHCGEVLADIVTNRDHIPTKALLCKPYPPNLPTVLVCMKCNNTFSTDEQYVVTFLRSPSFGSIPPDKNRLNKVILKNARGHVFFECGEPMLEEPTYLCSTPLGSMNGTEREKFEDVRNNYLPEVGSRMLNRFLTGHDLTAGWIIVQADNYRYCVDNYDGFRVRTVIANWLATEVFWE